MSKYSALVTDIMALEKHLGELSRYQLKMSMSPSLATVTQAIADYIREQTLSKKEHAHLVKKELAA